MVGFIALRTELFSSAGLTPIFPTLLNDVRISSCCEVVVGQESTGCESIVADYFYQ